MINLLLVEDDRIDQIAFSRYCKREQLPYHVTIADSVSYAQKLLQEQEFDIAVIDYFLGRDTAFDLVTIVEKMPPYIVITGHGDEKIAVEALKLGASDYLIKSRGGGYLMMLPATIEKALAQKQAQDELVQYREHLEALVEERTQELRQEIAAHQETIEALQESEARFRTLVNSMDDIVFTLNPEGQHVQLFGQWVERASLTEEHFIGKTAREIMGEGVAKPHEDANALALTGQTVTYEWSMPVGEEIRYYQTVLSPIFEVDGAIMGLIGVGRDITETKKAIQENLGLLLERERTQILADFLNQVSHEFRTPLSSININAYLLKKSPDPLRHEQYCKNIEVQTHAIQSLLETMNILFHLDSVSALDTVESNLCDILRVCVLKRKEVTQEKNIEITLELENDPLMIMADLYYLEVAIGTILDNAIQFTPEEGHIQVRGYEQDGQVIINIIDDGIGIDKKDLSHIFERFFRVDKAATERGFGLGLPIAKTVVDLHGGEIEVESEIGKGARFTIRLAFVS